MIRKLCIASFIAVCATVLALELASARGGANMGNQGASSRGPTGIAQPGPKADRPTVNFTKMKLLNCHKYARGTGMGGPVNYVTVCS